MRRSQFGLFLLGSIVLWQGVNSCAKSSHDDDQPTQNNPQPAPNTPGGTPPPGDTTPPTTTPRGTPGPIDQVDTRAFQLIKTINQGSQDFDQYVFLAYKPDETGTRLISVQINNKSLSDVPELANAFLVQGVFDEKTFGTAFFDVPEQLLSLDERAALQRDHKGSLFFVIHQPQKPVLEFAQEVSFTYGKSKPEKTHKFNLSN